MACNPLTCNKKSCRASISLLFDENIDVIKEGSSWKFHEDTSVESIENTKVYR